MASDPSRPPLQSEARNSLQGFWRACWTASQYVAAYLVGVASSVALTPAELELAGTVIWPYYLLLSVLGYVAFYFLLNDAYLPFGAAGSAYWLIFIVGLVPIACELCGRIFRSRIVLSFRPLWLAFPIAFVGTVGVYYAAAMSI